VRGEVATVIRSFSTDWMWDDAVDSLQHAERIQRRFFSLIGDPAQQPAWEPPVDVFETGDGIRILIALPGVRAEQVTLLVDAAGIVVQTERAASLARECVRIHRMEIPYGRFERRIDLPAGRYTLREQRMTDGCLELHLTKE
jgi:HSP20 family molecular chaperone IbpA